MSVSYSVLGAALLVALAYVLYIAFTLKDEYLEPSELPELPNAPEAPQNAPEAVSSPEPVPAPMVEETAPEAPQDVPEAVSSPEPMVEETDSHDDPLRHRRGGEAPQAPVEEKSARVVAKKVAKKAAVKKVAKKKRRRNPDR